MSQAAHRIAPRLTQPEESCTHGDRIRQAPVVVIRDGPHAYHLELRALCSRCGLYVINRTEIVSFQGWHVQCGPPGR